MLNLKIIIIIIDIIVGLTIVSYIFLEIRKKITWEDNKNENVSFKSTLNGVFGNKFRLFNLFIKYLLLGGYLYSFFILNFSVIFFCVMLVIVLYVLILSIIFIAYIFIMNINKFTSEKMQFSFSFIYILLSTNFIYLVINKKNTENLIIFIGLILSLILSFMIIKDAIFDPYILKRKEKKETNKTVFGSMVLVIVTIFIILFLMVVTSYKYNPALYIYNNPMPIDWFDLLYYTFISFTTIGYGDIHPVRAEGLPLSQIIAIIISIMSFVSLSCFLTVILSAITHRGNDYIEESTEHVKES